MRRTLAVGFGLAVAWHVSPTLSSALNAQTPITSRSPVKITAVRTTDDTTRLARGQSNLLPSPATGAPMAPTAPMTMPMGPMGNPMGNPMGPMGNPMGPMGNPMTYMGAGPMPPMSPSVPFSKGPSISELRTDGPTTLNVPSVPAPSIPAPSFPATPGYPYAAPSNPGVTFGPATTVPPEAVHPTTVYPQAIYGGTGGASVAAPHLDAPLFDGAYPLSQRFTPILGSRGAYRERWWVNAEYLLFWTKSSQFPALVTTSNPADSGFLGAPSTQVVFGDGSFGQTLHSGGRFGLGRYLSSDDRWSVDGSVFFLSRNGEEFRTDSSRYPLLARPFTNANTGAQFSQLVAAPGLANGAVAINYENSVWGADVNFRRLARQYPCSRCDWLWGFRYLNISEQLQITESFARVPGSNQSIGDPNVVSGSVFDRFRTENHFYGGTIGFSNEVQRGQWFLNLTARVGIGRVHQQLVIDGGQNLTLANGTTTTAIGGLLAVPGNIGSYSQNKFAVVPEIGFNIGYNVTSRLRLFLGYNFLYTSSVLRPGDQIDSTIDLTRIPNFPVDGVSRLPTTRPTVPLRDRDFFVQGINFGLQYRW